jgi:hypothetical protein
MQFCLKGFKGIKGGTRTAVVLAAIFGFVAAMQISQPAAVAQSTVTGAINGTVTDPTGAVVPGATVTVKDTATGAVTTFTSNAQGRFVASFLKPDTFDVSATAPGLQSTTTSVQVLTGQQSAVNLTMTPSASNQTVQVSANQAQLIDTQSSNLTTTFTTQQFQNLPAPGGDITTIAYTLPGVVVNAGGAYGNFSSDGLPGISNLVIINGADDNDPFLNLNNSGSSNLTIGQEEIAQAAVIQNGYSTEYGRQAGAIETYTTKSGANRMHGLLQYNYNSAGLNANYFFNNLFGTPKGKAVSNQYAAQIGGPIKHDKLFFFADTEGLRYILPVSGVVNYPTPAFQNTILNTVPAGSVPLYTQMFKTQQSGPTYATATPVTNGTGPLQDANGLLGCGSAAGTPVFGASGEYFGAVPTGASGTAIPCVQSSNATATNLNREWLATGRLDWNINDKHKLFVRVTDDQGSQPTHTSFVNPLLDAQSIQPSYSGQLNDTYVVTPNLTNMLIASGLYYSAIFKAANQPATLAFSPTLFYEPFDGGVNSQAGLGEPGGITGFEWFNYPQGRNVTQYQVIDEVAWLKGNHSFKIGGNLKRDDVTDIGNQINTVGGYYYMFGAASYASGVVGGGAGSLYLQNFTTVPSAHSAIYNLGIYAQDEWRVKPNLVIDYGVRIDRNGNPACTTNCFSHYNGGFPDTSATLDTPYTTSISYGHRSAFPSVERAIVQPRVGFNWDTKGDGKTVVRGGVGLFSDQFPAFIIGNEYGTYPYLFAPTVTTGDIAGTSDAGSAATFAAEANTAQNAGFYSGGSFNTISASLPAGVPFSPPTYFTTPGDFKSPRYMEYNLQVQRALGPTDAIIVNYSGTHGYDLLMNNTHLNQNLAGTAYTSFDVIPAASPDPRFAQVAEDYNGANSNYNGLSVTYKHADRHGLTVDVNYNYSHSMDDVSNGGTGLPFGGSGQNITSQITPNSASRLMYSNSDYDIRNNFDGDFVYVEPNHFANKFEDFGLGGWTLAAKYYWRSGEPFSVINSAAQNALNNGTGGTTVLADVLNNNFGHSCNSFSKPCFQTPGIFANTSAQNNFGNVPRNSFRGPHYADVDLSVYKAILHLTTTQFQVGIQTYNVFNHPNFGQPGNDAANPGTLGVLTYGITPPTSPYGSFQGSAVGGRVAVVEGRFTF